MAIRQVTRAGVGLVVGIIILGLLVLGGLWLVRDRGEQARRQDAIAIADQQLKKESDQGVALNTDDNKKSSTEQDPAVQKPATTDQANGSTATNQPSSAAELPKTGPGSTSIVVIGVLSFAVMSFIRSRKLVSNQL